MGLDVPFPSACELYLDGRLADSFCCLRGDSGPVVIEHAMISESSFAPFIFSPLVVTGEKALLLLSAYLELKMDATR